MSNKDKQLAVLTKNSGFGIAGRLFFLLARFVIVILITRNIGVEQYGIFVLAKSIVAIVGTLSLLGLGQAMVKFVAQFRAQGNVSLIKSVISLGIKLSLVSSVVLSMGIFLVSDLMSENVFHEVKMAPVLHVMIWAVPFSTLAILMLSALQGAKLVKYKIIVMQFLVPTIRFVTILIVFGLGYQLMGVAWASVITSIFSLVLAVIYFRKIMGSFLQKTGTFINGSATMERKKLFSFSMPLLFTQLFNQNISSIGILIIGAYLPAEQVGVYGVAMRVTLFIMIPFMSFNAIFSPIISDLFTKDKMKELSDTFKTVSRWVLTLTLPMFALIVFFSEEIVYVFGSDFTESSKVLVILLIGQVVNVGTGSNSFILSMTGRPLYNLFNSGTLCVLNVALTMILVSKFGVIGAAYAFTLSTVLIQLIQIIQVWHLYKIQPYRLDHFKPIISCMASTGLIYYLKSILPVSNQLISVTGLVIFFLCSYGIFLLLTGLSPDDRMIINKMLHKLKLS